MESRFLPLFVALPLLGAFLMPLAGKLRLRVTDLLANIVGAGLLGLSGYGLAWLISGSPALVYRMGGWLPPLGIVMVFDSLTALVSLALNLIGCAALLFSVRYLDQYTGRWKFYTLFMLILAGLNGVVVSGDIFNVFVFMEISAVASYALVAFGTDLDELEAGFKYMVIGEIGGAVILWAIALLYARASTLNMADAALALSAAGRTPLYWLMVGLFLTGFAVKMAMVPFHAWLPDAHPSAPAPVSALLSGVFIKVLGVYTMCRLMFNVFGLSRQNSPEFFNVLLGFGLLSIVVAGLMACVQKDYKRLLAYSSISQIGYILIGLGIGTYWGIAGALLHLLAHAVSKGLLFLSSGSIEEQTGTRDMEKIAGLEKTMPVTAWSYLAGALSLAGMPPFIGFFSKLLIIIGAVAARMYWLAVIAALFSVVTLGYLVKVVNRSFFLRRDTEPTPARESGASMLIAMVFLVVVALALGVGFKPLLDWVVGPAAQVLLEGLGYCRSVFGG